MENLKHTRECAEKLAKEFYPPQTNDLICSPNLVRDAYLAGYMKAIEETAAPDMLEALIKAKTFIQSFCLLLKTNPESFKEYNEMISAINKATK